MNDLADCDQAALELFEERAAIQEHDGGLSRADAEVAAKLSSESLRNDCEARYWVGLFYPDGGGMEKQLRKLEERRGGVDALRTACREIWRRMRDEERRG